MQIQEKQHWDKVYESKDEDQLSWFQPYPKTSVEFLKLFRLPHSAQIIDVGGGDSHFADAMLALGYTNITVLDISSVSIEKAKARLGNRARLVKWIVSDVTEFKPSVQYDFWHDRAAFHFLTGEDKIYKYVSIAEEAIKQDGYLILGTFSEKGPAECSGLAIQQYSEAPMSARFEIAFDRIKCIEENHPTPFNTFQNFLFCSFKKK